jgi:DNA-binding beta-propeller fold protein YncE
LVPQGYLFGQEDSANQVRRFEANGTFHSALHTGSPIRGMAYGRSNAVIGCSFPEESGQVSRIRYLAGGDVVWFQESVRNMVPYGVVWSPLDGQTMLVSDSVRGRIVRFIDNGMTHGGVSDFATGIPNARGIALSPNQQRVYVVTGSSGQIRIFDRATATEVVGSPIAVAGAHSLNNIVFNPSVPDLFIVSDSLVNCSGTFSALFPIDLRCYARLLFFNATTNQVVAQVSNADMAPLWQNDPSPNGTATYIDHADDVPDYPRLHVKLPPARRRRGARVLARRLALVCQRRHEHRPRSS